MIQRANSLDALPDYERLTSMSGLQFMQGILDGTVPGPPIGFTMGFNLYDVERGRVTFRGAPQFEVMNPMGSVHGGWYGTILDSCMACAVMTEVPLGSVYTTLEYKINMMRPVFEHTEPLKIIGESVHAGRRTATAEGRIVDSNGKLYATGTTTCMVLELPKT